MHGGLSPELKSLEQIKRIARPTDVPDSGLLCDLLWADPEKEIQGWGENDRGVSYTFGPDCVTEFLQKHDLDLVCRAHQVRSRCDSKDAAVSHPCKALVCQGMIPLVTKRCVNVLFSNLQLSRWNHVSSFCTQPPRTGYIHRGASTWDPPAR